MNPVTANRRHYEDLATGETIALGRTQVTKDMITTFATEFDPFPFHLDEKAAKASLLGGLASSGWQTAALSLRLLVDAFLSKIASMGSFGFTELKWKQPLMVDDIITGTATITSMRRSNSSGRPVTRACSGASKLERVSGMSCTCPSVRRIAPPTRERGTSAMAAFKASKRRVEGVSDVPSSPASTMRGSMRG